MHLFLLRHGAAEDVAASARDEDRALTREGREKVAEVAQALNRLKVKFDLVLSSPYARARETAEILIRKAEFNGPKIFSETLLPSAEPSETCEFIFRQHRFDRGAGADQSVLLVGHEPHLGRLISFLVTEKGGGTFVMKKAGICRLELGSLIHPQGKAALRWLLTPRLLGLMS